MTLEVKIICHVEEDTSRTAQKMNNLADALDEFFDGKCLAFSVEKPAEL